MCTGKGLYRWFSVVWNLFPVFLEFGSFYQKEILAPVLSLKCPLEAIDLLHSDYNVTMMTEQRILILFWYSFEANTLCVHWLVELKKWMSITMVELVTFY